MTDDESPAHLRALSGLEPEGGSPRPSPSSTPEVAANRSDDPGRFTTERTSIVQSILDGACLRGWPTQREYVATLLGVLGIMVVTSVVGITMLTAAFGFEPSLGMTTASIVVSFLLSLPALAAAWAAFGATMRRMRAVGKNPAILAALLLPGCGIIVLQLALYWCLTLTSDRDRA